MLVTGIDVGGYRVVVSLAGVNSRSAAEGCDSAMCSGTGVEVAAGMSAGVGFSAAAVVAGAGASAAGVDAEMDDACAGVA